MALAPVYSTISAAPIAAVLDQRYAIGPVARCRLIHRGFNNSYEFNGADGQSYIARLSNRRFRGPANIAYETALLTHLLRSGIVVGVPIADREGGFWRMQDAAEGPRELAVFKRVHGRGLLEAVRRRGEATEQTLTDVRALGASLARIHRAGDIFDGPASLYRLDRPHLLDRPLAQIALAFDGELAEEASAVVSNLGARLDDCTAELSIGHCHGDNHAGNTLIGDSDGALAPAWFDFDDGGPGFLAYDLATFLWSLLLRTPSGEMKEEIAPLWHAFIAGYRSVRPIPQADIDAVGVLVGARHVWIMGNFANRLSHTPIPADWFRQGFALVRKWDGLAAPSVGA